jgi:hypothetical protein
MHPTIRKGMPEFDAWKRYFGWLGQYPVTFARILDEPNSEREFTVPELQPEWFDLDYANKIAAA